MIDDVAAGMLGVPSAGEPGSLALDDVGDGFRVPDAVFGKRALASPSKTGSQRSRGDDADGASSGKKRRRDAHSQGDLETQHMVGLVGYADDDQPFGAAGRAAARSRRRNDKTRGWSRRSWREAAREAARAARASAQRTGSSHRAGSLPRLGACGCRDEREGIE